MDARTLIAELNRRRVFRALVGYGIAAFAVLQIIEPVMHGLHWPDSVLSYAVVALASGFPIVVTLAWIFDVGNGGIQRTAPSNGLRGARLAALLVGIGVLTAAPGLFWNFFLRRPAETSTDRSIAVLPLASAGDENGYFAQGIHDELLRQLASVGDLQVISRTSVLQYKDAARNLREIGEALGVASILEGSVQRVGSRVRVEAKLIDARTDRQIWADRYDRDVTDVLAIESAVAEEIVHALHARLSPGQKAQLERKPTRNPQAYDDYLRGLDYLHRPGWQPSDLAIAASFFRKAIDADQSFALARARLSYALLYRFWFARDMPDAVVETARQEAERSLQLEPDLPEGHLAMGLYHYFGHRDYVPALKQFEIAQQGIPAEAAEAMAFIFRRQGRFDEAVRKFETVARLDPLKPNVFWGAAETLVSLRRYDEADRQLDRALGIAPDHVPSLVIKAVVPLLRSGETGPGKQLLQKIRGSINEAGQHGWRALLLDTNPQQALAVADSLEGDSLPSQKAIYPRAFLRAAAHEAMGENARAFAEYASAIPALEAEVNKQPGNGLQRALLARGYAAIGRRQAALREANRAVETLAISKDAFDGPLVATERARAEARAGESDAAIGHIRELLAIPSLLSPALLRVDPTWGPLRNDPRFRQLAGL